MRILLMAIAVLVGACGRPAQDPDSLEAKQLKQANTDTQHLLEGASAAQKALEVFGVLPSYSCGPLVNLVPKEIPPVSVPFSCVTMSTRGDGLDFTFGEGCEVGGHRVSGKLGLDLGRGTDRIDVSADFRNLKVDGKVLPVRVGAGVCGDEKRVWATVDGLVVNGHTFRLDAMLGIRKGLPIIGHTSLVLNGTGSLEQPEPKVTTSVAAEELEYEIGDLLPVNGKLTVNRTDGLHFSVRFTERLWKLGEAEIVVGDRAPVNVPIVR